MGQRRNQFGRLVDVNTKSLQSNMKRATALSSTTRKPDKFDKPSAIDKVLLAILRAVKKKRGK